MHCNSPYDMMPKALMITYNVSPVFLDAGAPVYMYEFQHRPEMHKETRPSFVKSDHADDIGFMFGSCFWNGHIKITGR